MILDARSVPSGTSVETDVCIIGAGAAGITLAREFSNAPYRVALLESGGMAFERDTQQLYEGQSIGRPFQDLTACRLRFFGGTTNHWGGWCVPYDEIDFLPRDGLPDHGWPFGRAQLDPWYARAQQVCKIGPYDYHPANWGIPGKSVLAPFAGPNFECGILQVSKVHFGPTYAAELGRSSRVTVYLHANAFHLDAGENDAVVKGVSIKTLSGNHFSIRARVYILAAGGIENPRLLLASGNERGRGLGNRYDLIGRYLMVHLVYRGGSVAPSNPYGNFDFRSGPAGFGGKYPYVAYMGLTVSALKNLHLPKIQITWRYQLSPVADAVKAAKRLIGGEGPGGSRMADLSEVIANIDGVTGYAMRKLLFGEGVAVEALNLECVSEQQPNSQSRVMLGSKRDRLGMPEVVVNWQPTIDDRIKAATTLRLLASEIGHAGFGRLHWPAADGESWPDDFYGDEHHMGTTRMHQDPKRGVVDENCRVHATENLYVAGSSVFPNSSANNSTLTIVALALRLTDHIKKQLN